MDTDILIVGAGLAGLTLADQLTQAGASCLLIDVRDRVGGRILTHISHGVSFDLGPAWFWRGQPRMAALTSRFDLEVFEQAYAGDMVSEDAQGQVHRGRGHGAMRGSYRVAGGLGQITQALAVGLPANTMHLSAALKTLSKTTTGIRADIDHPDIPVITAHHVVLALPPRVAATTIAFDPPLPNAATDALRDIPTWMAGQAKMLALYDRPIWRDQGLSGDASSRQGPMVELHDASPAQGGPYALFGFVGFPAHTRAAHHTELMQMARDQLGRLFGSDAAAPTDLILKDWAQDAETATPDDHAASAHPRYGRPAALRDLWEDRLIFGSTEMAAQFGGYLEGALEAAEDVAALLKRAMT